jgi:glycerol uptake facilitator-like aquaporin
MALVIIIIKMLGIFFFEMLGTAAITGPASIFYEQATL